MNEVIMLHGAKLREILQTATNRNIPLVMSHLCGRQWNQTRIILTDVRADSLDVKICPKKKSYQPDIQTDQSVGISFKYGYGSGYDKFVFSTTVIAIKSSGPGGDERIVLAMPEGIEVVQKKSFLCVEVPKSLQINVSLWHRDYIDDHGQVPPEHCCCGRLVNISADSVHITVDAAQSLDFRRGQSLGLRFTPMPHETPLVFNAELKDIMLTEDERNIHLALEMIGLEASPEGRLILQRLCNVAEQYHQMTQAGAEKQDMQPISL